MEAREAAALFRARLRRPLHRGSTQARRCRPGRLRPPLFQSCECFVDTYRCDYAIYQDQADAATRGVEDWRDRVRATAYALYRFLVAGQARRHFHMIETRGNAQALVLQEQGMQKMFDLIDEGRQELAYPDSLTRAAAEQAGGGIFGQILLAAGGGAEMPPESEIPELMYMAMLPYVGVETARQEYEIPPPPLTPEHPA